jgi:hypothetical protein
MTGNRAQMAGKQGVPGPGDAQNPFTPLVLARTPPPLAMSSGADARAQ